MRKISIIHPTRNRPALARETINKWLSSAAHPENIEYLVSMDLDEAAIEEYIVALDGLNNKVTVIFGKNTSAVQAINHAANYTSGDILIVVSDDFDCPDRWDEQLLNAIGDQTDILVKTEDGAQTWIITLPIMDRVYYNRFGYIYYPGYVHMFCDTEMTHVGDLLGRTIKIPIRFRHNHYSVGGGITRDAISDKNDRTWGQGEELYLQRIKDNFGLEDGCITGKLNCHPGHRQWMQQRGITIN